mmetsp:Transcript_17296/g.65917  ORF Transcript_17296/g.65917 Transcript_17296/m.65917 type:complete len:248 (-) Transcript_17296:100-843(-)
MFEALPLSLPRMWLPMTTSQKSMKTDLLLLSLLLSSQSTRSWTESSDLLERPLPELPQQFSATVTTIAHLVDQTQDYPPWRKIMNVRFDYEAKLASAQIEEGHDAGKLFIRRYDQKWEYMIASGKFPTCERAYLTEEMPAAELSAKLEFQGLVDLDGVSCEHWKAADLFANWHVFVTEEGHVPRRVVDEFPNGDENIKVMTYEFENVQLGPQDSAAFELPAPYTHKSCERQIGGYPYIHAFLHFVRF